MQNCTTLTDDVLDFFGPRPIDKAHSELNEAQLAVGNEALTRFEPVHRREVNNFFVG
jgi:hypothetical protein